MRIFKKTALQTLVYAAAIILFSTGCNQISEKLQRHKFEFLYKLNNYAALYREYGNSIIYFKDLDFFKGRMNKLYEDINRTETIDGWGESRVIKEEFLSLIELNLKSADELSRKKFLPADNIRKEYEVIMINERINDFIIKLNDEISKAGKE